MSKNRLSVKDAARLMNTNEQFIRISLQRGLVPFGHAVKLSSNYTYYISIPKFSEYTGIPVKDIEAYCEKESD